MPSYCLNPKEDLKRALPDHGGDPVPPSMSSKKADTRASAIPTTSTVNASMYYYLNPTHVEMPYQPCISYVAPIHPANKSPKKVPSLPHRVLPPASKGKPPQPPATENLPSHLIKAIYCDIKPTYIPPVPSKETLSKPLEQATEQLKRINSPRACDSTLQITSSSSILPSRRSSRNVPQILFYDTRLKLDLLPDLIDASIYSETQIEWFLNNDMHMFNNCLDFVRCSEGLINRIFPSKYSIKPSVPRNRRHRARSIRDFKKLGQKQQETISELEAEDPPSEQISSEYNVTPLPPCLGLRTQYICSKTQTKKKDRKQAIQNGFDHLVREAIRARADLMRDTEHIKYHHESGVIICKGNNASTKSPVKKAEEVRYILKETCREMCVPMDKNSFFFVSSKCTKSVINKNIVCWSCEENVRDLHRRCIDAVNIRNTVNVSTNNILLQRSPSPQQKKYHHLTANAKKDYKLKSRENREILQDQKPHFFCTSTESLSSSNNEPNTQPQTVNVSLSLPIINSAIANHREKQRNYETSAARSILSPQCPSTNKSVLSVDDADLRDFFTTNNFDFDRIPSSLQK